MTDTHDENGTRSGDADRTDRGDAAEPARPDIDPAILADAAAAVTAAGAATAAGAVTAAGEAAATDGTSATADGESRPATDAAGIPAPEAATAEAATAPDVGNDETGETPADSESSPLAVDVADPDAEALGAIPLPVRIEAALFAATEPLPLKRLKEITGCPDGRLLRDTLDVLAASYAEHGRAFRVEEVAQGFQLRTSAEVAVVVQRLGRRATDEKLSTAALETLAVVAYRQPVLRADIERIRGVACGEVLRALQERGLVRAAGRAELPGSPILYGTTQRFLEIFGLRDIQDLPKDREVLRRPD